MRLFKCQACQQLLYFENTHCVTCKHRLGYLAESFQLSALSDEQDGAWTALAAPQRRWTFCENASLGACNWLIPAGTSDRYCSACRHNRMVPDLSDAQKMVSWRKMELAKHRLFYQLMRLRLPLPNRADDPAGGLVFDFLADPAGKPKVLSGHEDGQITLALSEADDVERERRRSLLREPYRTLLGHFRHEVGHFYWDRLVRDRGHLVECRALFGDDEADYAEALRRHYKEGPPPDWRDAFVSSYATMHAWEDFAETWAHYLHIVDSLETAGAFGLEVHPTLTDDRRVQTRPVGDPYDAGDFPAMVAAWLPLTFAMNSMNRSMGLGDLYPFELPGPVVEKLGFMHRLVHGG